MILYQYTIIYYKQQDRRLRHLATPNKNRTVRSVIRACSFLLLCIVFHISSLVLRSLSQWLSFLSSRPLAGAGPLVLLPAPGDRWSVVVFSSFVSFLRSYFYTIRLFSNEKYKIQFGDLLISFCIRSCCNTYHLMKPRAP